MVMYELTCLILFLIPAVVLGWRLIVTKSRTQWLRAGAAGAAMVNVVGACVVFDDLLGFSFKDWRSDVALAAASTGSIYLLFWSYRKHSNRRHRTLSIIAAIVGFVPVIATAATALLFRAQ